MLTPATITVNFLANYAGNHRVCWRIQGSGDPYVCTNVVPCDGGGNPCSVNISIMVDPESCDPVVYEGYIQATCNAEGSTTGQVPFEVTYTPNPVCKAFLISTTQGGGLITGTELGINCDGSTRPDVDQLFSGQTLLVCNLNIDLFNLPSAYSVAPALDPATKEPICCKDCKSYTVSFISDEPGAPVPVYYTDCATGNFTRVDVPAPYNSITVCATVESVTAVANPGIIVNVTDNGPC